jgi:hypothetical protein
MRQRQSDVGGQSRYRCCSQCSSQHRRQRRGQLKDRLGDQRGGSESEPIKILLKELCLCQSQHQKLHTNTNCQDNVVMDQLQVLRTIPRSTRGSTRKEAKEPNNLGKNLLTDRTVRLAIADCLLEKGRIVQRIGRRRSIVQKSPPTEKHRIYLNSPPNGLRPLADSPPVADCLPTKRGRSVEELHRNTRTCKSTSLKSSSDLPNG